MITPTNNRAAPARKSATIGEELRQELREKLLRDERLTFLYILLLNIVIVALAIHILRHPVIP